MHSTERVMPALGYAAAAWAFLFAAVSAYWALGGEFGLETIAADISRVPLASDPAVVWGTALLKALAGMLALAAVQPWGRLLPRRPLLVSLWSCGALLTLHGLANLIDHGRMVAGFRDTPEVRSERAARCHLFFWAPWWLLGGVMFLALAWRCSRVTA